MSSFLKQLTISVIISYACSISARYLYAHYVRYRANRIPTKWKRVGTVDKIIIYPLKSGTSRELSQAICTDLGLREIESGSISPARHLFRDRSFVIYDVQTQKAARVNANPKVLLISMDSTDSEHVVIKGPGVEDLILTLVHCGITFNAVDCGDEAAKWLSNYFTETDKVYRLGYYAEALVQRGDPIGGTLKVDGFSSTYKHWRKEDGGVFADLTSYMILAASTIRDLSDKMAAENQFSYRNLRGNIVVEGSEKYAEDEWKWIKIGERAVFRTVKLCTRCTSITIDPDTGEKNVNMEPLKTLRTYRTVNQLTGLTVEGDKGVLGIQVGLYSGGEIHLDDPVYVDV